jgi:hypothetical protein
MNKGIYNKELCEKLNIIKPNRLSKGEGMKILLKKRKEIETQLRKAYPNACHCLGSALTLNLDNELRHHCGCTIIQYYGEIVHLRNPLNVEERMTVEERKRMEIPKLVQQDKIVGQLIREESFRTEPNQQFRTAFAIDGMI